MDSVSSFPVANVRSRRWGRARYQIGLLRNSCRSQAAGLCRGAPGVWWGKDGSLAGPWPFLGLGVLFFGVLLMGGGRSLSCLFVGAVLV